MIEFRKLVINNFLSFGERQVIPLAGQGVVRIEGQNNDDPDADSNRAGKSAIVEALLWCLYGRTIRGVKHDSVVNRFAKRDCFVSAFFRNGGRSYHARRYRRHNEHGNRLRLWAGDSLISSRHEDRTQSKLEEILGCDFTSFTNSAIFGGARPFAAMSDAEQKKILESFLHFEQFDAALRSAKHSVSESFEKRNELRLQMEKERGTASALRARMKALQQSEVIFERDRSRRKEKAQAETNSAREELAELRGLPRDQATYPRDIRMTESRLDRRVSVLNRLEAERAQLRKKFLGIKKSLRHREELIGRPCPTCGRLITERTLVAFLEHIRADRQKLRGALSAVKSRIAKAERRVRYGRTELKRLRDERDSSLNLKHRLEERLSNAQATLREVRSSNSPFSEELSELAIRYSRRVSQMLVLAYEMSALEKHISDLRFWEVGFGNRGVKALIVREALPALNEKLQEYAHEVFHGSAELQFVASKKTKKGEERELFHIHYAARKGSASYLGESSGGRRRVDVCVLLTFAWLSQTSNLLLIDELLDGLDETGRESVLGILARLRGTVLVISHRRDLKAQVGKVWTVAKKNGISTLELSR